MSCVWGWKCTSGHGYPLGTLQYYPFKSFDPHTHTHTAWTLRPPGRFTDGIKQAENISHFLEGASSFGLPLEDCFQVDDLRLDDDMARVVLSLSALKSLAES